MTRINLNSLSNLKNFAKFFISENPTHKVLLSLANKGEDIINEAYRRRDWFDVTGNLHDSFVSAVFLNGKLERDTIRYVGTEDAIKSKKIDGQNVYGRDEANRFMIDYERSLKGSTGITLVIAAAMYYSSILENRGYRVISHVSYMLDEIKRKGISIGLGSWTASLIKIDGSIMRTTDSDDSSFSI